MIKCIKDKMHDGKLLIKILKDNCNYVNKEEQFKYVLIDHHKWLAEFKLVSLTLSYLFPFLDNIHGKDFSNLNISDFRYELRKIKSREESFYVNKITKLEKALKEIAEDKTLTRHKSKDYLRIKEIAIDILKG